MAICVYDIFPDGTARVPADSGLTGPGTYRWWHLDLTDAGLEAWLRAKLPDIPATALLQEETRPRCDRYEKGLILNLRGINMNEGQQADRMVSIRMWAAADVLITARVRRVFALDDIRRQIEAGAPPATVGDFLEDLVSRLIARVQDHVMAIADLTDDFEESIGDASGGLPAELGETRRSVIRLRRYLEPQRAALQLLSATDVPLLSENDRLYLRELANRSTLAVEELDALRDRMASIQDHHDTQAALRQGRNSYALSIVAAVFLPLGFVTGLFGVNVGGMPGVQSPIAFSLLCLGMALLAGLVVLVLRWIRLL